MRKIVPISVAALLILGGCNKNDSKLTNASPDDVAKAVGSQQVKLQPGEWEMTVEVLSQDIKGTPAGMPATPKLPPVTTKICLTKEQVDKPEGMFANGQADFKKNCTFDSFEMSNGKIDTKMHCNMPNNMKVETAGTGTFSPTELTSDSTATITGMPGGMSTTSHTKMTGKRIGDCTGAPAAS